MLDMAYAIRICVYNPEFRIPNGATLYCHVEYRRQRPLVYDPSMETANVPLNSQTTLIYFALPILSIQYNKTGREKLPELATELTLLKSVARQNHLV